MLKHLIKAGHFINKVPTNNQLCKFTKHTVSEIPFAKIETQINQMLTKYDGNAAPLIVDPIFRCADPDYAEQTVNFINNEYLPNN